MFGPLRLLYGLPSRRKSQRPATLPLKVQRRPNDDWTYMEVSQERYPFLVTFPYLGTPRILSGETQEGSPGAVSDKLWIRGASPANDFDQLLRELVGELQVHALMPESKADVPAFCRLIAKIAYSFAVAELGPKALISPLRSLATDGQLANCLYLLGSRSSDEPPTGALHELDVIHTRVTNLPVIRVRLLARLGTPTYFAVISPKPL